MKLRQSPYTTQSGGLGFVPIQCVTDLFHRVWWRAFLAFILTVSGSLRERGLLGLSSDLLPSCPPPFSLSCLSLFGLTREPKST